LTEVFLNLTEGFLTLTEVFPCFFLSCKANARIKLAKTEFCPHSFILVVICVVRLLFVLFYILFVCKCVLPPGDNPATVNKYINININKRIKFCLTGCINTQTTFLVYHENNSKLRCMLNLFKLLYSWQNSPFISQCSTLFQL